jgi:hypothetical protein
MKKTKNKKNDNMARSKRVCKKAAKARWAAYWKLMESISPSTPLPIAPK